MRRDWYYYVGAAGEWVEGHIWATDEEAATLKQALKDRIKELRYTKADRPYVTVELAGDYDYAFDEETRPEAVAKDICSRGGFIRDAA